MTPAQQYVLARIAHFMDPATDPLVAAGVTPPYTAAEALAASFAMDPVVFALARAARLAAPAPAAPVPVPTPAPPAPARRPQVPLEEAQVRVADWFAAHRANRRGRITRDRIAAETGVSAGGVNNTGAWQEYAARREQETPAAPRTVPLSDEMLAAVPDERSVDAFAELTAGEPDPDDPNNPNNDEAERRRRVAAREAERIQKIAALEAEQEAERRREERQHKKYVRTFGRHGRHDDA